MNPEKSGFGFGYWVGYYTQPNYAPKPKPKTQKLLYSNPKPKPKI